MNGDWLAIRPWGTSGGYLHFQFLLRATKVDNKKAANKKVDNKRG